MKPRRGEVGTWFFFLLFPLSSCELYSALAGLETLLDTEQAVIDELDEYLQVEGLRLKKLERARQDYKHLLNASKIQFQDFVSNPINAFILMKKLSIDWNETRSLMMKTSKIGDAYTESAIFPDLEDLSGAAKAVLRVQQTYNLDTRPLSEGLLIGAPKALSLSADDCLELGRQAYYAGYLDAGISWLERAEEMYHEDEHQLVNSSEIAKYHALSIFEKRRNSIMLFTNSLLQLGYMMSPPLEGADFPASNTLESADSNNVFMSQTNIFDEAVYRTLCQSKNQAVTMTTPPSSRLRCRLLRHPPPLLLQPVREEQLWAEPKVSLFHDIFSDAEIDTLKKLALPQLQRAEVAEYTGTLGHRVSDTRVTKIAWLRGADHPLLRRLYRRLELVTGLSSVSAEPFQMANYGLGGHFHLHMDVLPDTEKYFGPDMGNRIATWLTYLSDVNGGGATVFPRLNLTVWPKKGTALFWHNVKSNGVGNILTLHGACPVVTGSKWVSNVWFHERGQEFRLKCGLHPESSLQQTDISTQA